MIAAGFSHELQTASGVGLEHLHGATGEGTLTEPRPARSLERMPYLHRHSVGFGRRLLDEALPRQEARERDEVFNWIRFLLAGRRV